MPSLAPLQIVILASLLISAWALGFFASTYEGKWRRRYRDERKFYAEYRDKTDLLNIEKTRRIASLEAENSHLRQSLEAATAAAAAVAAAQAMAAEAPAATAEIEDPVETQTAPAAIDDAMVEAPLVEHESVESASVDSGELHAVHQQPETLESIPAATEIVTHPDILPQVETVGGEAIQAAALVAPAMEHAPAPMVEHAAEDAVEHIPEAAAEHIPEAVVEHVPEAVVEHAPEPLVEPVHHVPTEPQAETVAEPVEAMHEHHAPIAIAAADESHHELSKIRGIDADLAGRLDILGIHRVQDIERLSAEDEKAIEIQLGLVPGHIASEQWRLQAALLGSGEDGEAVAHHEVAEAV